MSTGNESITATDPKSPAAAIPPVDESTIPLPPVTKTPVAPKATSRQGIAALDGVLLVLVLVLSFFLGAFAANNSDLWMHMALGRALLSGAYNFGVDPFAFTTEGLYWVNHAWLYDVCLYGLYSLTGDLGVIIVKALLVMLLALVLYSLRLPGQSAWIPLCVLALGMLTMSPRLVLQPSLLSLLFLGLTLFVLVRTSPRDIDKPTSISLWWLVPLFVLWANVDALFWFGPLTVALFTVGEWLQQRFNPGQDKANIPPPGRLRTLMMALGVGILACLLNPHHVNVFTLPPELAVLVSGLPLPSDFIAGGLTLARFQEHDPQHTRLFFISSLYGEYYAAGSLGRSVAALAFFPLLLLGVTSFILNARTGGTRFWRVLVFVVFALLGLAQLRLVPFFAVVAVPITVLNLQEFAMQWTAEGARVSRGWSVGGRLLTALTLALLLVLAWPGWLYTAVGTTPARAPRRVALRFEEDASLKQAALALAELQKTGKLANGFNYSAEVANYAAWHVPGYKGYFDYRFPLFVEEAENISRVRRAFQEEGKNFDAEGKSKSGGFWQKLFRDRRINYFIVNTPEVLKTYPLAHRMYFDPQMWTVLYCDGRTAVLGWHGLDGGHAFAELPAGLRIDARAEAFGPATATKRASWEGANEPQRQEMAWFWEYVRGRPSHPLAYSEAVQNLFYASEATQRAQLWDFRVLGSGVDSLWMTTAWLVPAAAQGIGADGATFAVAGLSSAPLAVVRLHPQNLQMVLSNIGEDRGPVAPLYLALRRARASLAQDPNDAAAYLALAQAYIELGASEDYWRRQQQKIETPLSELRHVQIASALNYALELQPDNVQARDLLMQLYFGAHYLDAALEQSSEMKKHLDVLEGKLENKRYEQMKKGVDERHKQLTAEVDRRRGDYRLRAERLDPIQKCRLALFDSYRFVDPTGKQPVEDRAGRGLILEALKALREYDRAKRTEGERQALDLLQLRLLLRLGMFKAITEVPNYHEVIGKSGEESMRLLGHLEPAIGNYAEADKAFAEIGKRLAKDDKQLQRLSAEALVLMLLDFEARTHPPLTHQMTAAIYQDSVLKRLNVLRIEMKKRADQTLLRAVVALEKGDTALAQEQLRNCLRISEQGQFFPDHRIAERLSQLIEEQQR
jgi:hypothetical protein